MTAHRRIAIPLRMEAVSLRGGLICWGFAGETEFEGGSISRSMQRNSHPSNSKGVEFECLDSNSRGPASHIDHRAHPSPERISGLFGLTE